MQNDRSIRIRTEVGENAPQVINVALGQTYDTLEILSLKLRQENLYKLFSSDYGVIVGRVLASGNFGVPNAKVSVFIEVEGNESVFRKILYGYKTISSRDNNGIRYNLLPDEAINACYQNVGTFPNKRYLLDNTDIIETFDKYWKYTTVTNAAGDYMLFGIPTGQQTVHVDIDLSDIGVLSQRPRDMMYQGFNINQFESPNKFKQSTDLTSLAQIKSQDKGVNVFPYWGDTTMDDGATIGITRCDIQIQYEFQPTCIFMGSIITDKASNAIGKNCGGSEKVGNMSELGTGEGSIEMIRKTFDGKTEEFQIKGNRLIDGDGVWCYQIPMNLDYVMTDEFGNTVPTDDPTKGIPTRTRVRFRISLDETPDDKPAKKRARYLVPNNPRISSDYPEFTKKVTKVGNDAIDYEFGSATLDEDFRDLMWNNVYTVKNYIPRIQTSKRARDRKNTAIKKVNYAGDNNPMPYNNLFVRLTLQYNIICIVIKTFITIVGTINSLVIGILAFVVDPWWYIDTKTKLIGIIRIPNPIGMLLTTAGLKIHCIPLNGRFCEAAENTVYFPGCPGNSEGVSFINATDNTVDWVQEQNANALYYQCMDDGDNEKTCKDLSQEKYGKQKIYKNRNKVQLDEGSKASFDDAELYNCVEQQLIEENESATFNFANDWVNGVLYAPLWFRKIKPKKKFFFGLITRKAKDKYCSTDRNIKNKIKIHQSGSSYKKALTDEKYRNEYGKDVIPYVTIPDPKNDGSKDCGEDCQKEVQTTDRLKHGIIKRKETLYSADAYYYAPIEYYSTKNINTTREDQYKNIGGEVKLLYATDIVLLGSLNDCDRFGLPQFFKVLEPTTYQLPPALLTKDEDQEMTWDATLGMFVEDDRNSSPSTTDTTGCDWGNANKIDQYYQVKTQWSGLTNYSKIVSTDGGLFYGVNCTSVDTVGKTNVNVLRLCELGVSLDETDEIENIEAEQKKTTNSDEIDTYDNLTADGFVSKDELYDLDARAAFATMNYNNLRTVFDEDRGIYVYDFRYLYPENFDGAMSAYMEWYMTEYKAGKRNQKESMIDFTTKTNEQVSYRFNYFLEKFNRDYYRFKMGKAPYFYEEIIDKAWHRFPRYENSYYFYFGLKFGKTAIEKFNSQFFSTCENTPDPAFTVKYDYQPNTWCSDVNPNAMSGYFAIETEGITTPYSVYLKNKYNESYEFEVINIENEKFVVKNKGCEKTFDKGEYKVDDTNSMCNGIYDLQIVDGAGNILNDTIKFTPPYLTYETEESVNFKTPFNLLMKTFEKKTDAKTYAEIANVSLEGGERNIGGVICLSDLVDFYELKDSWNNYKIRVTLLDKVYDSKTGDKLHWDISILNKNISEDEDRVTNIHGHQYEEIDGKSYITVPIGNVTYSVEVIQMCNGIESQNRFKTELSIGEPKPLKLFINNVDSQLFKIYKDGDETHFWDVNLPTLGPAWFDMRNSDYYDWEKDSNYQRLDSEEEREAYQNEIFNKVESAFIMTKYGEKGLTLRVDGEDEYFPVIYNLYGQTEESTDKFDMDEYNNTLYKINGVTGNEVEGYTGVQTLPIAIPNVTPMDSFLWSSGSQITIYKVGSINAVWAQTNPILDHGVDDFIKESEEKKEYKCSAITATGVVIPSKKDDVNMIELEPFKVIFIDKILTHEIISWAAPVNFPHYGNVTIAPNTYITENGFVMGKVVNGIATDLGNDYRKFETQYLGNQDLRLTYYGCNESSYPIYSYIDGGEIDRYDKVQVYENGDRQQYAFLPPLEQTLEINDGRGSGFTEECYGNMKVSLSSSSYDNGNSEKLIVNCNITNEDVNYYFYKIDDKTHPYDRTGEVTMNVWKGKEDKYMFSFQTKSDDLRAAAGVDNWNGSFVDDEGTIKPSTDTKEGYKAKYISTGIFENNKEDDGQYFVIAETANGTRAISPVYDFSNITVDTVIYCEKDTTKSEADVDVSGKGSSEDGKTNVDVTASGKAEVVTDIYTFSIGFKVKKSNAPYYPLYYDYKMEGIAGGSSIGAATLDALESGKETYLKVPLDTNKAKKVVDFDTMKVKKGTEVSDVINVEKIYVTDVTGLKHLCKIEPEINENLVTDK